jgi:hypothetical protein
VFSEANVIGTVPSSLTSLAVADLDGDSDLDGLSASAEDDTIAWYENAAGELGEWRVVTDQADGASSVAAADLDRDGDLDILAASARDDVIAWYDNLDQSDAFSERKLISTPDPVTSRANFVSTADLDGDGDLDVLSASYTDQEVAWYEHLDGQGTFGPEQVLMTGLFRHIRPRIDSVYAADLDSDGDLDVVSADEFNHKTYWAENLDGRGTFAAQQPVAPFSELTGGSFQIVDLDRDGDSDILAASDHEGIISWHENRLIGDSNDDGLFNTADLVQIFAAGEYLDDVAGNSTFDEGDWNLDGDFTPADLILAFQAGTYGLPARMSRIELSAAVDLLYTRPVRPRNS